VNDKSNVPVLFLLALLAAGAWYMFGQKDGQQPKPVPTMPCPDNPDKPCPVPTPDPKPKPRPKPWGADAAPVEAEAKPCNCCIECKCKVFCACRLNRKKCSICCTCAPFEAKVGGPTTPSGKPIACDLPEDQHCKNISSRGQGCCTQTSVNHSARWQNIPALIDFHQWVKEKGLPGGGSPGTMEDRIPKCCKDRGYPVVPYIQVEGGKDTLDILRLACKTGRMPAITYSVSPTGRYSGQRIAHMTSLLHADGDEWCQLDNNYIGAQALEHLSTDEFLRAYALGGSGWAVILLPPGPPPPPKNLK
jgi:hypothetical protein